LRPLMPTPAHAAAAKARDAPIRVLLADDHTVTLWGLGQLVESAHPRLCVSGTASTCAELLAHPALPQTDVVLLDLRLQDANAIHCIAPLVNEARVQVVLLTGDVNPSHHRDAVLRGARGVVLKSQPTQNILDAIERVHAGEVWFDGSLMSMLLGAVPGLPTPGSGQKGVAGAGSVRSAPQDDATRRIETLTPKERQVIQAMVKHRGVKNLVVADALGMSEHTLSNHLTEIYSKLAVPGKLNLYVYAMEHRLADMSPGIDRRRPRTAQADGSASGWDTVA
jgi:DNA-binding NarL/FixJ family response regulator